LASALERERRTGPYVRPPLGRTRVPSAVTPIRRNGPSRRTKSRSVTLACPARLASRRSHNLSHRL
jgi:hypothetical protein